MDNLISDKLKSKTTLNSLFAAKMIGRLDYEIVKCGQCGYRLRIVSIPVDILDTPLNIVDLKM